MKSTRLILAIFLLQLFNTALAFSPNPRAYSLPDSVKAITDVSELKPFLTSAHPRHRIWGAKRLGQIGTANDIPQLKEIYENEPFREGYGAGQYLTVKYFAIKAIGDIGGSRAEFWLIYLINDFDIVGNNDDSLSSFRAICESLENICSPLCKNVLLNAYKNKEQNSFLRETALKCYYLCELKDDNYLSASDSVTYLVKEMKLNFAGYRDNPGRRIIIDAAKLALRLTISDRTITELDKIILQTEDNIEFKKYLIDFRKTLIIQYESSQENEN